MPEPERNKAFRSQGLQALPNTSPRKKRCGAGAGAESSLPQPRAAGHGVVPELERNKAFRSQGRRVLPNNSPRVERCGAGAAAE